MDQEERRCRGRCVGNRRPRRAQPFADGFNRVEGEEGSRGARKRRGSAQPRHHADPVVSRHAPDAVQRRRQLDLAPVSRRERLGPGTDHEDLAPPAAGARHRRGASRRGRIEKDGDGGEAEENQGVRGGVVQANGRAGEGSREGPKRGFKDPHGEAGGGGVAAHAIAAVAVQPLRHLAQLLLLFPRKGCERHQAQAPRRILGAVARRRVRARGAGVLHPGDNRGV